MADARGLLNPSRAADGGSFRMFRNFHEIQSDKHSRDELNYYKNYGLGYLVLLAIREKYKFI